MNIHKYVYDCGDNDCCIECKSIFNEYPENWWNQICNKHKLNIGSKFRYNLSEFISMFKESDKTIYDVEITDDKNIYDVEIIDIINPDIRDASLTIVRMKTKLDCSILDKKIFDLMIHRIHLCEKIGDEYIITLRFNYNHIERTVERIDS